MSSTCLQLLHDLLQLEDLLLFPLLELSVHHVAQLEIGIDLGHDSKAETTSNDDFRELEASANSCSSREITSTDRWWRVSTASLVNTRARDCISMAVEVTSSSGTEERSFSSIGVNPA